MISTKASSYSLFLLVSLALALTSYSSPADEAQTFTVRLSNNLGPGSVPATVRFTSPPPKEDTFTTVVNRGESFSFDFNTTIVHWSCDISSGAKKGSFIIM